MNFQIPYRISQIDLNKIVYTKIKNLEKKRIIYIKYADKGKQNQLVFQPPSLLNLYEPVKISEEYHEIEFPLISQEKDKAIKFINFMESLDDKIINDAKINSKLWFSSLVDSSAIKYKRTIKESEVHKDGMLKIKIIKNIDFETLIQNNSKKRITIKDIPQNTWCKMLLEVYAIIINQNGTFSLFIRPIILSFKPKEINNYNYNFLEDSDEEIPDSDINNLFIKSDKVKTDNDLTTSAIPLNLSLSKNNRFSSSTSSSDSLKKLSSSSEHESLSIDDIEKLSSSDDE